MRRIATIAVLSALVVGGIFVFFETYRPIQSSPFSMDALEADLGGLRPRFNESETWIARTGSCSGENCSIAVSASRETAGSAEQTNESGTAINRWKEQPAKVHAEVDPSMTAGSGYDAFLYIERPGAAGPKEPIKAIKDRTATPDAFTEDTMISSVVRAWLDGGTGFEVKPDTSEKWYTLEDGKRLTWRWTVTPNKLPAGHTSQKETVRFNVEYKIKDGGEEHIIQADPFPKEIEINVNWFEQIIAGFSLVWDNLDAIWKVVGGIVIAIGAMFAWWRRTIVGWWRS